MGCSCLSVAAITVLFAIAPAWGGASSVTSPIDVFTPRMAPQLMAEARFEGVGGEEVLEAGSTGVIRVTIKNRGTAHVNGAIVTLSWESHLTGLEAAQARTTVGLIVAGESVDVRIPIHATREVATGTARISLRVSDAWGGDAASSTLVVFRTRGQTMAPTSDVDQKIPAGREKNQFAVAVVIGNRDYQNPNLPDVDYAIRDAESVGRYLEQAFGYLTENVISVDNASLAEFNQLFGPRGNPRGRLFDYVRREKSDVFVYYSGHGAPDPDTGEVYFIPSDADPDYIGASGYPVDVFWENLAQVPARTLTVVLDACFSGGSEGGFLLKNASPARLVINKELTGPEGSVVMASAGRDQVSSWYPEQGHGLFTYYWLKGIGGAADVDQDRGVTVSELRSYLEDTVPYHARRLNHRTQTPQILGQDNHVLVRLLETSR